MSRRPRRRQLLSLAFGLLIASAFSSSGCMPFLHRAEPPSVERVVACKTAPAENRDRVHIFMIHGVDPFDWANMAGVRDYLHGLGFGKTYYGQMYHTARFEKELRRIHCEDPEARFVLIGFSFGANLVRMMANHAQEEGIPIDLLVYLGGNTLKNEPRDQPENVAKIINILAAGCIWNGAWMDRAENIHVTDVFHFGSPAHPVTLEVLAREMAIVARHGAPLDAAPAEVTTSDGWECLRPLPQLEGSLPLRPAGPPR